MSAPSKRMLIATRQVSSYIRKAKAVQRYYSPTSTSWVCTHCSHRILLSTPLAISHCSMREPIGPPLRLHELLARTFSKSAHWRDDRKFRDDLPSAEEGRRSHVSKRFDHLMDNVQSNIFIAGQRLNDLTGYSGIEALKKEIEQQELFVQDTRDSLQHAREAYTRAISQRSTSQREVNELLQRKHAWSPTDLERFTELYRSDHANEQAESAAQHDLAEVEKRAEEAAAQLSKSILSRYHEEQIWSDKIRRMSTWGTWGLMGVNVLLFLIFQIGVEPWRRKRLVKGFEEKVMEALEREGQCESKIITESPTEGDGTVGAQVATHMTAEGQDKSAIDSADSPDKATELEEQIEIMPATISSITTTDFSASPMKKLDFTVKYVQGLFSDRQIAVRQKDLMTAAMEGAAAGVAFTGLLLLLLRLREGR